MIREKVGGRKTNFADIFAVFPRKDIVFDLFYRLPEVDLTPYRAGAAGVSRLHAVVMDPGSSNRRRIQLDVEVALSHQDIIAPGTLQI